MPPLDEDDDDRPLTPEEIAEAEREWIEANARFDAAVAAEFAAQTAGRPSVAERNGSGPAARLLGANGLLEPATAL